MEITADIVKQLRDATGAGMMDCKKALVKAEGDFAQAEKILKEMGLAAVAKRSGRQPIMVAYSFSSRRKRLLSSSLSVKLILSPVIKILLHWATSFAKMCS